MGSGQLPKELSQIWARQLKPVDWDKRVLLINEFHDNLKEMIPDFEEFCDVFPAIVQETLVLIGEDEITCESQAHIFANSADQNHRLLAGAWFRSHNQGQ